MKQRIALVAASALTAGFLSVVSAPVANAAGTGECNVQANGVAASAGSAGVGGTSYGVISGAGVFAATSTPLMYAAGTLTVSNVTITSGLSNVTYFNLLNQSSVSPFTIGSTLISSVNGTTSQVLAPITLSTLDANGNQATKILTPVIDPYQQQSGVIELKQPFRIDGFTKLTFSIFASTSIQFQFYPSDTINIARGLGGNAVSKQYGSPKIIRPASR